MENKNVFYEIVGIDKYGRTIARVFYGNGKNLSEEILKNGFGWHYLEFSNSEKLADFQENAKQKKLGLWIDKNPCPPRHYLKINKYFR